MHHLGGNGGGLVGGQSLSAKSGSGNEVFDPCPGANQTSGGICPSYQYGDEEVSPTIGDFGGAVDPRSKDPSIDDIGGIGGGGYYGGTSYYYAFAGSGGSSFISGHLGCDAVEENTTIHHTGQSIHYSGLYFTQTRMINGSEIMPLPSSSEEGILYDSGYFRITILDKISIPHNYLIIHSEMLITLILTHYSS